MSGKYEKLLSEARKIIQEIDALGDLSENSYIRYSIAECARKLDNTLIELFNVRLGNRSKYDCVLFMKDAGSGLSKDEVNILLNGLNNNTVGFVDIPDDNGQIAVSGFINWDVFKQTGFNTEGLARYIKDIINNGIQSSAQVYSTVIQNEITKEEVPLSIYLR